MKEKMKKSSIYKIAADDLIYIFDVVGVFWPSNFSTLRLRQSRRSTTGGKTCQKAGRVLSCYQVTVLMDGFMLDAIDRQLRDPALGCPVQVTPESVDVRMRPPYTTAASFCR